METLVVVAHPQIDSSTTQQFFKSATESLNNIDYHVLGKDFNIDSEQQLLLKNDRIIFQFPMYWYSAPGLLKTWLDDVLTSGFVERNQNVFSNKELGLVVTTGSAEKDFQAGGRENFSISEILKPFEALANKTNMKYLTPLVVYQFLYLKPDEQQQLLVDYQQYLSNPHFQHLNGQINWFIEQLQQKITQDDTNDTELETLMNFLKEQQDTLEDLQWNLDLAKKDED